MAGRQSGIVHLLAFAAQGWWLRVEREVGSLLAPRPGSSALPGDAVGRLDRLETAVGRLQTVLEAAARQLEASAANSQARGLARPYSHPDYHPGTNW